MKKIVNIYKKDQLFIRNYVTSMVKNMPKNYIDNVKDVFKKHKYVELIYAVNSEFIQTTPAIHKHKIVQDSLNSDKSHYFLNVNLDDGEVFISNPYMHHSTGKPSVSVVHRVGEVYYVLDINLVLLLEELKLIEYNSVHEKFIKLVYLTGATLLSFIALSLIGYGAYVLIALMTSLGTSNFLHDVFKAIIAVTIGLAMFDLSKQIMEHDVLFRSLHTDKDQQFHVLANFLISIIIALSIETLMVVFKIVLDDYENMLSAFYLLLGTTIMFVGLAYFYATLRKNEKCSQEE